MVATLSTPDTRVCQELDDLLLQYMALIDEHLAAWNSIADRFQQGREQISQAKYIMGPRNVSADCYDHRMKALRGVAVNGPRDIVLRDLWAEQRQAATEAQEADQSLHHGIRSREASESGRCLDSIEDQQGPNGNRAGLRRRAGAGASTSATTASESASMSSSSNDDDTLAESDKHKGKKMSSMATTSATAVNNALNLVDSTTTVMGDSSASASVTTSTGPASIKKKKERNPDPLLWFGVFVPAPLRNAQGIFQKGLQDVVEMARIRLKLLELEEAIKALQIAKSKANNDVKAAPANAAQSLLPDVADVKLETTSQNHQSKNQK